MSPYPKYELVVSECEHEWSDYHYPDKWPTCVKCGVKWPGVSEVHDG